MTSDNGPAVNGPAVTSSNCVLDPRKNETLDVTSKKIRSASELSFPESRIMTKRFKLVFCVLCYYLMFIFVTSCVLFYYVCFAVLHTLVAGLLARSQYPEGPATGHLGAGFPMSKSKC